MVGAGGLGVGVVPVGTELIAGVERIESPGLVDVVTPDFLIAHVVAGGSEQVELDAVEEDGVVRGQGELGHVVGEGWLDGQAHLGGYLGYIGGEGG